VVMFGDQCCIVMHVSPVFTCTTS